MSRFIDFEQLKAAVSIEQAAEYLGLHLKSSGRQLRGPCPACNAGGERALAITPEKQLYFCFSSEIGGDCIRLVAHIRGMKQQEAAHELAAHFLKKETATPPQNEKREPTRHQFDGDAYGKSLDPEHPAVEAVGFDPDTARALGIGYSSKGVLRGTVAVPLRLPDGTLVAYAGVTEMRLPSTIRLPGSNVVPLKRGA